VRFGSDKAGALVAGKALIDHVADALRPQTDALIVCGRDWPGLTAVTDRPGPDLGPLGGLCAALFHAAAEGFDAVLTAGCDVLPVPPDLVRLLAPAPAYIAGQQLFGLWPAGLAGQLETHLAVSTNRSIRGWIAATAARAVPCETALFNFNRPADLAGWGRLN